MHMKTPRIHRATRITIVARLRSKFRQNKQEQQQQLYHHHQQYH